MTVVLNYFLDPVGNRLSLTSTLAGLGTQSFTYDADDRLAGDTHDANGNTLTSGGNAFGYEFEDRLVNFNSGAVQMIYDGDGNRVVRTAGGVTTRFLVDEQTPTGYGQVAEEVAGGSVVAQYTYGLARVSQNRAGTVSYYGYDPGMSVRELVNSGGTVTDTYAYDAFGNLVAQTGSTVNAFLYRGEQFDAAMGMYYLRARWYVVRTGRFLTADGRETVFAAGQWMEIPLPAYQYGNAEPVDLTDPSGDAPEAETITGTISTPGLHSFMSIVLFGFAWCNANQQTCQQSLYRGRIHAQGDTFGKGKASGTGDSETWVQPVPPPGFEGFALLTTLWVRLSRGNQIDLGKAFQKAAAYITVTCPGVRGCYPPGKGFANESNRNPRKLPPGANRVDVDIQAGVAFAIP